MDALQQIQDLIGAGIAPSAWAQDARMRAEKTARFRRYHDGDFDHQMTAEMRRLANMTRGEFGANYCQKVIAAEADRLRVSTIDASGGKVDPKTGKSEASSWVQDVMDWNRFDALQIDLHENALIDAESYMLVSWDNDKQRVVLTQEMAYDGTEGIVPIYRRSDTREMYGAVKIWHETRVAYADTIRVNVYLPGEIKRYIGETNGNLSLMAAPDKWEMADGKPIGVPIIAFSNRGRGRNPYGLSELESVTPLQDQLIRHMYSMTVAAEIGSTGIRWAKGFEPPKNLTIGMWVEIAPDGLPEGAVAEVGRLEGSPLEPYVMICNWTIEQILNISGTPMPSAAGAGASGEALKQRESDLIAKCERFQIKIGNAWEDVFDLAWRVQSAYSTQKPPVYDRFYCKWRSPQTRNEKDTVDNVLKVKDLVGETEAIRLLAAVFDYDEATVNEIIAAKRQASADALRMMNQESVNLFSTPDTSRPINGNGKKPATGTGDLASMTSNEGANASPVG